MRAPRPKLPHLQVHRWALAMAIACAPPALASGWSLPLAPAEPLGDGRLLVRHAPVAERRGDAVVLAAGR